jgi:hypothetical protein
VSTKDTKLSESLAKMKVLLASSMSPRRSLAKASECLLDFDLGLLIGAAGGSDHMYLRGMTRWKFASSSWGTTKKMGQASS